MFTFCVCDRAESFGAQSYICALTSCHLACETRVLWHAYIHICMYLCRCATLYFIPGYFYHQLLSFCISFLALQLLTRTCHTSIEILICWASFPPLLRLCTRFVAQTILYQSKARSPRVSPQASLSAFVNPCCCQSLASSSVSRSPLFTELNCAFY